MENYSKNKHPLTAFNYGN